MDILFTMNIHIRLYIFLHKNKRITAFSKISFLSRRSPGQILDSLDIPRLRSNPAEFRSEHPPTPKIKTRSVATTSVLTWLGICFEFRFCISRLWARLYSSLSHRPFCTEPPLFCKLWRFVWVQVAILSPEFGGSGIVPCWLERGLWFAGCGFACFNACLPPSLFTVHAWRWRHSERRRRENSAGLQLNIALSYTSIIWTPHPPANCRHGSNLVRVSLFHPVNILRWTNPSYTEPCRLFD